MISLNSHHVNILRICLLMTDVTVSTPVVTMSAQDPDQGATLVYFMEDPRLAFDQQDQPVDPATVPHFNVIPQLFNFG